MKRVDTTILAWKKAQKTKNVRAKSLASLLTDQTVRGKFLLDTLEGTQALGHGSIVCLGVENDVWQQTSKKLFAKYTVTSVDDNGWMTCEPKPENETNAFEVTEDMTDGMGKFYIIGQWGKDSPDGPRQDGVVGDWIGNNPEDPDDVWIIVKKIFNNTYSLK